MSNYTVYTPNPDGYTPSVGVFHLLEQIHDGANRGTGICALFALAEQIIGPNIPQDFINYAIGLQNNLFGGYPTTKDVAPSGLFAGIFALVTLVHLLIFIINFTKGHYFYLTLVFVFASLTRFVSFMLRLFWAQAIQKVKIGLTDEVLLVIPSIILVSFNLILAQRLFTWRHPVGGSRKLFWGCMFGLYALVIIIIAVTATASLVPYIAFLSTNSYLAWQRCVMASSVLVNIYTLTAIALIGLSFWLPTTKDENLYTYQPWWIESFSPFYFVEAGAAQRAEETFMKRNHNHRHAVRVIAATHHHYKMVKGLSNQRGDLSHNTSLLIISISTLLLFVSNFLRSVAVFQGRINYFRGPVANPIPMYMAWGVFEFFVHLLFIVGRVDLRFYRPDILPLVVRSIITAEQSVVVSDAEDNSEGEEFEGDDEFDSYSEEDMDEGSLKHSRNVPPIYSYPVDEPGRSTVKRDDESEFFF
ncbi:hypothetical protein DFJ63DRAFT_208354 [Scheffersomyces coipomensis]|uniref:uncharacterized protein n=1 Tax=Scheffersomyces coipomensis TaxID=1788519 RepID=UPI00315DA430